MKDILKDLNKAFENRVRLGIMSALLVNESLSFVQLKRLLDVTDGNLASHIKALENKKYIDVKKIFLDRKPNTRYSVTELGEHSFRKHLNAIENLLKS